MSELDNKANRPEISKIPPKGDKPQTVGIPSKGDMPQNGDAIPPNGKPKRSAKDGKSDNDIIKEQLNGKRGMGGGPGGGPMMRGILKEKPKDMKKTLGRLFKYIGGSKYLIIGLLLITVITTLCSLAGPALQGKAIDFIHFENPDGSYSFEWERLVRTLAVMGALYLLSSLLSYFSGIWAAKLSQDTVYRMRSDLFGCISYLPVRFTDTHSHGDVMSRMTNDVDNISTTVSQSISSLFSAVITLIGSLFMMLYYSPLMTLVAMITIPVTIIASAKMAKLMRKYFVKQQRILGSLNGHIEEMVTGCRTVIAYSHEGKAISEFDEISDELKKTGIAANVFGGIMGPMMNVIGNIGFLLIAVTGGWLAIEGAITIGVIQAFIQYSKQFTRPINEIANQYSSIITAIAGAERVFEIMDAQSERDDGGEAIDVSSVHGDLSFKNVDFSYVAGEQVLKDFNLEVKAGQKIAIVGRTGSGKTTIVNLLTRFYDTDGGSITLDGRNINTIAKSSLRSAVAIVLQDTVLFSDSIAANIRYGRLDAGDGEVRSAAHTANADTFIERLPEGYETVLSESGGNLSQGQRQLLSIARAVLADPKILILDEATSSVDTRTEMQIQQAMLKLMAGRTSLIIAHRLSTIRDADVIIVLSDGKIAEAGNHETLLEKHGVYYDLYQTQFAGVET